MVLFFWLSAAFLWVINPAPSPHIVILGTVQDAGSPHIGCEKDCCIGLVKSPDPDRMVVSLGLIDPGGGKKYLFEATPDLPRQMRLLNEQLPEASETTPDGIFLTHAHIGHYTGLMYLGREALGARRVPVYAMPRLQAFLETNGPWSQLVLLENIQLTPMENEKTVVLSPQLRVTPIRVPHRDEYSETVGFRIDGPQNSALFIPDIDKWDKWDRSILEEIRSVDYAFVDATFFSGAEIDHRDISEIPHPSVEESMARFGSLSAEDRGKVYFIHFNHTNPLLLPESPESKRVEAEGYQVARLGSIFPL